MASLGCVTPGRQLRVSPLYFFPEKPGYLFFSRQFSGVTPDDLFDDLFCSSLYPFLLLSLGCHPPRGCHPTPILPVRPRFSTILCKFAHNFFPSGVTPWCNTYFTPYKAFHYRMGPSFYPVMGPFYPREPPPPVGVRGWSTPALMTNGLHQLVQRSSRTVESGVSVGASLNEPTQTTTIGPQ